ncbi:MAG TPA: ABC transporter ATP-binding protein [Myxococcaceae bacterium]|nr:ABC transporter ATP-binding protein [Myxococcaceae bacterium]
MHKLQDFVTAWAIEVDALVKRFDALTAVDGISFSVTPGTCVGLLGPNGAGKTTTVEILEGLQEPTSGSVRVLGKRWADDPEALRARIGIALQETRFYEKLTVRETVTLFRSFYPGGTGVDRAIAQVDLGEKQGARVGKLSGGQRQRLALAVALVGDPELLFLDEPTTGLDPVSRRGLWDVIEGLKARGRTVVLTTHYMEEAQRLCEDVIIVDHGKVVARGSPAELVAAFGGEQIIEFEATPALSPEVCRALPGCSSVRARNGTVRLSVRGLAEAVPALLRAAETAGATLVQLSTHASTLDDVFLNLTGRSLRDEEGS